MLELNSLEGVCPTCKHYAKQNADYPCCICDKECNMYEAVNEKIFKYDVRLHYLDDHKAEIFDADKVSFLGTVLLVIKGDRQYYYPIYQVVHYEIIEKEVDTNGTKSK